MSGATVRITTCILLTGRTRVVPAQTFVVSLPGRRRSRLGLSFPGRSGLPGAMDDAEPLAEGGDRSRVRRPRRNGHITPTKDCED